MIAKVLIVNDTESKYRKDKYIPALAHTIQEYTPLGQQKHTGIKATSISSYDNLLSRERISNDIIW